MLSFFAVLWGYFDPDSKVVLLGGGYLGRISKNFVSVRKYLAKSTLK